MTKEQNLLLELESALMISPQGYHRRGAAHRAFVLLMGAHDVMAAAWEAKMAQERSASSGAVEAG